MSAREPDSARDARIHEPGGPWCDKAFHLATERAPAVARLTCASCGRVYARCADCEAKAPTRVRDSMAAHVMIHKRNHELERRVLPPKEWR